MKKIISLVISLAIFSTLGISVFATESATPSGDLGREEIDAMYYSEEYQAFLQEWYEQEAKNPMLLSGGNKKLNVTNYKQTNDCGCGPACIYQIGKYLGLANMESLSSLTNRMTDNNQHGTDLDTQLKPYLNDRISTNKYVVFNVSKDSFFSLMVNSIDKNRPVICHVKPDKLPNNPYAGDGHYVVAVGYDWYAQGSAGYSKVTYNDPHMNNSVYGTYTCDATVMTEAIRARYGYFLAA